MGAIRNLCVQPEEQHRPSRDQMLFECVALITYFHTGDPMGMPGTGKTIASGRSDRSPRYLMPERGLR